MQPAEQVAAVHLGSMIFADDGQPSGPVRCLKSEGAVWTMPVVVLGVDPQDLLQAPSADDQQPVQALGATVPIHRSAKAFALGAWTGVSTTSASSDRDTSSKAQQNFASRLRSTKRTRRRSPSSNSRLRPAGRPGARQVGGHPRQMDPPGIQLDEEQHVQPPQPDSLDGEEVAGHDPGRLLPEERLPSRGRPARGRIEPMTSERCAGRSGRAGGSARTGSRRRHRATGMS
jgi:hypothetical protein